ncbi:MAG: CBS domain-containing protein [Desulfobacterales bacterium]|jgi:CBS domain-containing protein
MVKELMVPLSEYAVVNKDATLYEAVIELEKSQKDFSRSSYRHRAILVLNENNEILGKISQMDALRALEPKYREIGDTGEVARSGFSLQFLKSMMNAFDLWQKPLADICKKAASIKVEDFMYSPRQGEFVRENANLGEAIHQLVMGSHHSLIVVNDDERIVGVLRLTDVFEKLFQTIKACGL